MGETKPIFVGIAIGILITSVIASFIYDYQVSGLDDQVGLLNETIMNMSNNTQLAYDSGFNQGVIYTANYTTLTGNFSYIENDELKIYSIKDYCDLN